MALLVFHSLAATEDNNTHCDDGSHLKASVHTRKANWALVSFGAFKVVVFKKLITESMLLYL